MIVNAASKRNTFQTLVKTDKQNALKIASLLEAERLKGIRVKREKEEGSRSKTAYPHSTTTNLKNKIRKRQMSYKLGQELLEKLPKPLMELMELD